MTATLRLTRKWGGVTDRHRCRSLTLRPTYLTAGVKPGLRISLKPE
jgi:hypothetical protein